MPHLPYYVCAIVLIWSATACAGERRLSETAPAPKSQNHPRADQSQQVGHTKTKEAENNKKSGAPVTITAVGNTLLVTSEDPAALALVSELVRVLTSTASGPGDFEVIRLHFANAVDTAKLLDESFNTPKVATNPLGGGQRLSGRGFGRPGGAFAAQSEVARGAVGAPEYRIRVVADPATNALLVQASSLDMLTIRSWIAKQLDAGIADSSAVIKTQPPIGPLKNLQATDAFSMVRELYRESMDNNRRGGGRGGRAGNTRVQNLNIDANGNSKGVTLTMAVDDKTNSLLVACPTPMYEDIKKLVSQMEVTAGDYKQTVKFVRVRGLDPAMIQQALDAVQGRTPVNRPTFGTK
jgi:type II secretory pathway component GspD/PulD (secretin)